MAPEEVKEESHGPQAPDQAAAEEVKVGDVEPNPDDTLMFEEKQEQEGGIDDTLFLLD